MVKVSPVMDVNLTSHELLSIMNLILCTWVQTYKTWTTIMVIKRNDHLEKTSRGGLPYSYYLLKNSFVMNMVRLKNNARPTFHSINILLYVFHLK